MNERDHARRRMIVGAGLALGGLAMGSVRGWGQPSIGEDAKKTALHQEVDLKASPQRIYEILLDSKQFSAFSGMPAEIHAEAGGTFSLFGGQIVGRNIELVPGVRIVQAWRPADWPAGVYSLARFELKPQGAGTKVIFDHSSFPAGGYTHLGKGWNEHYWGPLAKYLG